MKVSVSLGRDGPLGGSDAWASASRFAVEAERLGVDCVWSAEAWGQDGVSPLAYLAAKTSRMKLGSGILQVGTRTPALLGMTAMTLASMSGGRFLLGLGTSGPQVMEGWHGVPFARPLRRMRETIEIVRQVTRGERLVYDGEIYQLPLPGGEGKALRTGAAPLEVPVPVYIAALGPRSLRMTGELADGWLGTSFTPESAEIFFGPIRAGAAAAGRSMSALDLQAGGAVEFTDDVEAAAKSRARDLAFTLGAMGSAQHNFYNDAFRRQGFADEASEVQRLWLEGRRDEARDRVPLEMALRSNLLGTRAMVKERVRAYRDAGVTTLRSGPAGADVEAQLETLATLMEVVAEVNAEEASGGGAS